MEWVLFILVIALVIAIIIMSELCRELENVREKISILEFEKREAYIRGCREGRKCHADE